MLEGLLLLKLGIHQLLMATIFHAISLDIELVNVEVILDLSHLMFNATLAISLYIRQMSAKVGWYGMDM